MSSPHVRPFTVTLAMVLRIAIPMTIAHISTPLIGIVDTAVIGQLGSAALIGGVAMGALLIDFIGTSLNFLRSGTTGLVAQAMGAEDREAEALALWRAFVMAVGAGVLIILIQTPATILFTMLMGPSVAVTEAIEAYVAIRVWGLPFMLMNYAILGWLLGLARARTGLMLQIVLGVSNIVGSMVLVLGLGWGVEGVAAASVLAELVTLAVGAVVVARSLADAPRPPLAAIFERIGFLRMVAVNTDILIRSVLLISTISAFTAVGARFGDVTLAANAVLLNILLLGGYMLDGVATAAEQLGGRAIGARYRPAFAETVRITVTAAYVIALGLAAIALVGGSAFVHISTTAPEVREAAFTYLPWAVITPLTGALAYAMDGLFIGATWTRAMRNMMICASALFFLASYVLTPILSNHGLWFALNLFLAARGVTLWLMVPSMTRRTFALMSASR
ncbi:MATE family efflux transporter [Acuticoccus sp. M5D2P5]|uniref:MATE family efflux transporter n=1 Tax=Acuticoccus kalidii TaxID=2910977 RepID=UPI001F166460|nr:MATE family efflux transporter [Acuticoccus kalidii]MCF3933998.1 MATE family efflux transporter [Acuticoccus kalidii]